MQAAVIFGVIGLIVLFSTISARAKSAAVSLDDAVKKNGIPARGLVLAAEATPTKVTVNGQRMEQRSMTLDVEIEGQAPYEITTTATFSPQLVSVLPGSSLDLRVARNDPTNVVVIGPLGSSAWIDAAQQIVNQQLLVIGAQRSSGVGGFVFAAICLALAGIIGFASASASEHDAKSTACKSAKRCCAALGGSCEPIAHMSEPQCKTELTKQKKKAKKLGITCE